MKVGRLAFTVSIGAAALVLAGCVVGPSFSPPNPDAPADWAAQPSAPSGIATSKVTAAEAEDAAWWKSFKDPELASLVDRALASNLTAKQAVLRIDEARAQRRMAAAGALPQVNGTASYDTNRISERTAITSLLSELNGQTRGPTPGGVPTAIPGLSNPFDLYQYGLTGSWELDLFGRVRRSVEAADADTTAAIEDSRAVKVALMAEVAAAYVDLRADQARREVAEESLATAKRLLRLAQDARHADLGDDLEISNASAETAAAQALLPPLDARAAVDRDELASLLALKPGALDPELQSAKAVPPLPPEVPAGLPSDLARRRPDVRRAEAQLHAAVAMQGVAAAELYPSFTLNASVGMQASSPSALADWAARYLSAGPALELPIFDAGQRRANIRLMDARAKEAAAAYAQTVLGALQDVEDALNLYNQEQARRASLQTAVDQSRLALTIVRRRYETGSVSFRDVLQAEDRWQQAELALTDSIAASAEDLVGLYRALGGGWEAADD